MNKSENIGQLAAALARAQGEMKAVAMNAVNPFLKNKYADLGATIQTHKDILSKNELSFSQLIFNDGTDIGVETLLMHSSGEWVSSSMHLPLGEEKGKNQAQVAGSIITYLRRYGLSAILGIHTEEDADGTDKKQKEEMKKTDEEKKKEEVVNSVKESVIVLCKELGGAKNEALMTLLKEYHPSGNPNKISDEAKLKELSEKLQTMKKEQVK